MAIEQQPYTPFPYTPHGLAFSVVCRCGTTLRAERGHGATCIECRLWFDVCSERLLPCGCRESDYRSHISSWCPSTKRLAPEEIPPSPYDPSQPAGLHHCQTCKGRGELWHHRGEPQKDDPLGNDDEPDRLETEPCPDGCMGGLVWGADS